MSARLALAGSLLACVVAGASPLQSGDRLGGNLLVRYSGQSVKWVACRSEFAFGSRAEFQMIEMASDQVVRSGSVPRNDDRYEFEIDLPRVGLYRARARACRSSGACTGWIESGDGTPTSCAAGDDYVYSILAPAGPVTVTEF